jgi:hypothetical protein
VEELTPQVLAVASHSQPRKFVVHCAYFVEPGNAPLQLLRSQLCLAPQVLFVCKQEQPRKFPAHSAYGVGDENVPAQPFRSQLCMLPHVFEVAVHDRLVSQCLCSRKSRGGLEAYGAAHEVARAFRVRFGRVECPGAAILVTALMGATGV